MKRRGARRDKPLLRALLRRKKLCVVRNSFCSPKSLKEQNCNKRLSLTKLFWAVEKNKCNGFIWDKINKAWAGQQEVSHEVIRRGTSLAQKRDFWDTWWTGQNWIRIADCLFNTHLQIQTGYVWFVTILRMYGLHLFVWACFHGYLRYC